MKLNKLDIKEIREDIVVFENGTLATIIKVQAPEYNKMKEKEQTMMQAGYRYWLSTLEHPIQITARTINIEFQERLKIYEAKIEQELRKKEKTEATIELHRFIKWIEKQTKKMPSGRIYYITIPYTPLYKKKKEFKKNMKTYIKKLNTRTEKNITILKKIGFKTKKLKNEDLTNLYSSYYTFSYYKGKYALMEELIDAWRKEK